MRMHKLWLVLGLMGLVLLAGCQKAAVTQATHPGSDPVEQFRTGELDPMNKLVLGTLQLEDEGDAVTPEQAADLLPLWNVIQSGSLKSQAETEAVLKQIEGKMTPSQLTAIEAMAQTREDMTAWMEAQGIEFPTFGGGPGGGTGGGFGQMGDLTEEERAQMREQFQSMRDLTPEERAKRLEELGIQVPEGAGPPAGAGGFARGANFLLTPLLELLTARAAE